MTKRFVCNIDDLPKRIGYYLAKDVQDPETGRLLLNINCKISDRIISALKNRGIDAVYISKEKTSELLADEDEEVKIQNGIIDVKQNRKALKSVFSTVSDNVLSQVKYNNGKKVEISKEMLEKINNVVERMIDNIIKNPTASLYLGAMDDQDPYILRHSANVSYMSLCLAQKYKEIRFMLNSKTKGLGRFEAGNFSGNNFDKMTALGTAGLLHDIGKVLLIEIINANKTYEKNDKIWERIKAHPKVGHDILFGKNMDAHALLGIKYHHENIDGTGYPYGIKGYKIHVYSRIIRVVDSFDAAVTDRPGKESKSPDDILKELNEYAGIHYDKEIVKCFTNFITGK